ncbi:MAG TPA: ABC transporter substrate-binding protein [Candidatus Limnocylindrales bacterium]|nr:ABC transporter substrate-binding protein [Candidatus Limnocylindrales bacterium]
MDTGAKPEIKIGSDGFYESKLVAEMFAQVLEADGYPVTRNLGIGARQVRQPLLEKGDIAVTPEYVGSGLGFYDPAAPTGDGPENRDALAAILKDKGITVFGISPGEDTNAAVVRKDTADQYSLTKMSDLAAVQDNLRWGLTPDCDTNPLCKDALVSYGITYPPKQRESLAACDAPIAQALQGKGVDFAWLCSTQPAIAQFGFVLLEDDKDTQPAENMTALVRDDLLAQVGDAAAFQALLDGVLATLTTEELTKLGVEVAVDQKDVADVAKAFLQANGLLK